jgi:hypothetical protein
MEAHLKAEKKIFEHFDKIYENREQYSMSWAFKDAQGKLNNYKEEVIDHKIKNKCSLCKKMNRDYKSYQSKSHFEIRKQKMISSIFSNVHNFVNFLEVILSVILVLVISELSHGDFIVHETKAFSVWVVIVFAFIKVFIDQLVLKPKIEKFGWKLYKNSVDVLKGLSDEIVEQVNFELEAI